MTLDNPHIRRSQQCPFCRGHKTIGLVACWPCYRAHDLRNGNPRAEHILKCEEMKATFAEAERVFS
jgi:hypothetical protein